MTHLQASFRVAAMAAVLLTLTVAAHAADVRFTRAFGDHAVLQRDKPVTIAGFADAASNVTVTFADQRKTATADADGRWSVQLDAMSADAKGRNLVAKSGGSTATLADVVVGDVILFARQTYIDVSLGRDAAGRNAAAQARRNPALRAISIHTIPSATPRADLDAKATSGWAVVDKSAALGMSAAAYYFGRDLAAQAKVPVGIIDLNMGPGFTIGWLSREALAGNDAYYGRRTRVAGYVALMDEQLERFQAQAGRTRDPKDKNWVREDPVTDPLFPAAGFNATLAPMRGLTLKAVLLQLGNDYPYMTYERLKKDGRSFDRDALDTAWMENYLHRKRGYRAGIEMVPRVPAHWRAHFGDKRLPFGLIMAPGSDVASYAIHNRETRELQRQTAAANPAVGLVLPGTDHVPFSGQPADEPLLARRALAWALASVYGRKDAVATGPLFERMEANYAKAQVFFAPGTAEGLHAAPGALDHFEVAGVDRRFSPAKAVIDGSTIRLTSDTVSRITDVRYNYTLRPDQGLTNGAGLPAIPFHTGKDTFIDVPRAGEQDLPPEYTTPANEWASGDVAIISGGGATYHDGPGWIGPAGFRVLPFGPNMRVTRVLAGSPADGKIRVGDMIYRINGEPLGDNHLHTAGAAIALAESEAGGGRITFDLRRGSDLHKVTLQLEVLGTYSATSPYDCAKADRIVANSEAYLAERGGQATGYAGGGWLYSDTMFLLAAGTPKYQGLVRRKVYSLMAAANDSVSQGNLAPGQAWHRGHAALLIGEYYLATGDRNALPALRAYCDALAATQCRPGTFPDMPPRSIGGWRHNYPGGQWYGMIPVIGLPAMIGMTLAKEAGVAVDPTTFDRGMHMFRDHQGEMGRLTYAAVMPRYDAPEPIDPDKLAAGMLSSGNGNRAMAAILFALNGDTRIAHLNSMYTAYAYNNCHGGHGSNFFNGLWTPLGANQHGKPAFINFMRHHYWYRDLKRMYNHVSLPADGDAPSVGHDLALVVPRHRLRIIGAPESVFAANPPAEIAPALDAYHARDYARASELAGAMLTTGELTSDLRTKATQLQRAADDLRQSIAADLDRVEGLIREGKVYEAGLDLPQLKGVMRPDDERLVAIDKALAAATDRALREDRTRYEKLQKSLAFNSRPTPDPADDPAAWRHLVTTVQLDRRQPIGDGSTTEQQATRWRVRTIEAIRQAPDGWASPRFDDSKWGQTTLPISWHLNHTLIARSTFEVDDAKQIEGLRVGVQPFRQLNIVVYINGQPVAKFNQCENNKGWVYGQLPPAAIGCVRNGKNTIAFATTNDWRWSTRGDVTNGGFGLRLDMKTND